jgi:para-aminobenzoate synthetase component 1
MLQPAYFQNDDQQIKNKVLNYLGRFKTYAFFESHQATVPVTGNRYGFIAMAGISDEFLSNGHSEPLITLDAFLDKHLDMHNWVFCSLSYDLKNHIEALDSTGKEIVAFPLIHAFVPQVVVSLDETGLICVHSIKGEAENIYSAIQTCDPFIVNEPVGFEMTHGLSKSQYEKSFNKLMSHIKRGDTYEATLCQQASTKFDDCDPRFVFAKLREISPNPFSVLYKHNELAAVCSSPERFMRCDFDKVVSQPMKGTSKRSSNETEDNLLKSQLAENPKEKSENVMIVDLVRNDLSRIATRGSVVVEELFGVHTFPTSHQMISTVSCHIEPTTPFSKIIKATFPMGSMTGAPKVSSMKIIDELEDFKRGLFSGSIGFFAPGKYFDFNVVIRTILMDLKTKVAVVSAGGAITFASQLEDEWNECLVKLKPQLEAIGLKTDDLTNTTKR